MKKIYLLTIVFLLPIILFASQHNSIAETTENQKPGELTFKAKYSSLWFKHDGLSETDDKIVETTLPGILFDPPQEIKTINKKESDNSTPESVITSYFSAGKAGNLKWILSHFDGEEKEKMKASLKAGNNLKESKEAANLMKSIYITGKADYKDYIILFIEQDFESGKKATEAIACKKINEGWKLTNEISADKTFDIVFAALNAGEVSDGKNSKNKIEIKKPKVRVK